MRPNGPRVGYPIVFGKPIPLLPIPWAGSSFWAWPRQRTNLFTQSPFLIPRSWSTNFGLWSMIQVWSTSISFSQTMYKYSAAVKTPLWPFSFPGQVFDSVPYILALTHLPAPIIAVEMEISVVPATKLRQCSEIVRILIPYLESHPNRKCIKGPGQMSRSFALAFHMPSQKCCDGLSQLILYFSPHHFVSLAHKHYTA